MAPLVLCVATGTPVETPDQSEVLTLDASSLGEAFSHALQERPRVLLAGPLADKVQAEQIVNAVDELPGENMGPLIVLRCESEKVVAGEGEQAQYSFDLSHFLHETLLPRALLVVVDSASGACLSGHDEELVQTKPDLCGERLLELGARAVLLRGPEAPPKPDAAEDETAEGTTESRPSKAADAFGLGGGETMIQVGETGKVTDALYVRADAAFRRAVIAEARKAAAPLGTAVDMDCVYQHQRQMVKIAFMRDCSRPLIPISRLGMLVALRLAKATAAGEGADPLLSLPGITLHVLHDFEK